MNRKITRQGLELIKRWEGLRLKAYKDIAGVWTIGYGHTQSAQQGMYITLNQAEDLLLQDLSVCESAVNSAVQVELSDNQFAALVSFAFNVGVAAFRKSTLLKKLNRGEYDAVPQELLKWSYAGGKRAQGLANRRAAESGLWVSGDHVASNTYRPDSKVRAGNSSSEWLAPIISSLSGLGGFLSGAGPVQWALALIMLGAAAMALLSWWRKASAARL